jgi:hypothetical protein
MFNTEMANRYNRIAGAHKYIVGFVRHDVVYYVELTFAELCQLLKDDRASSKRGGTLKLRVRVTAEQAIAFSYLSIKRHDIHYIIGALCAVITHHVISPHQYSTLLIFKACFVW